MQAVILLLAGAMGLLIAVLALTRSLISRHAPSPGRRAVAHWLPVAVVVLVAAGMNQAPLALSILFGSSVACLSVATGFIVLAGPLTHLPSAPARIWPFLPVPALLTFVLGFHGAIGLREAGLLFLQGLLSWLIWSGPLADKTGDCIADHAVSVSLGAGAQSPRITILVIGEVVAGLAVAAVAAWAITRGVGNLQIAEGRLGMSVLAATAISTALIMPMILTGTPLAAGGQTWAPLSGQVGLVLLNLGLLLPATILLHGVVSWLKTKPLTWSFTQPAWESILYPRISWRIDALALVIASLLLVPVSQGNVRLDRRLGIWLIVGYCAYLLGIVSFAVKP